MQDNMDVLLMNNMFEKIDSIAKGDLHNHASNGGMLSFINNYYGKNMIARVEPFCSINDFEDWVTEHIAKEFPGCLGYLQRITAAFIQCQKDCIKELCMSFTLEEIKQWRNINRFISIINRLKEKYLKDVFLCQSCL